MKDIIKKWWFWLTIVVLITWIVIGVKDYKEKKELESKFETMAEGMTDYYEQVKNAEGYSDYFIYNYSTGEVEYHPPITIERYDSVKEGMTEKQVVSILGNGEKLQPEGSNGFLMTWGELEIWNPPYYRIQITFDSAGKVSSKSQMGLE